VAYSLSIHQPTAQNPTTAATNSKPIPPYWPYCRHAEFSGFSGGSGIDFVPKRYKGGPKKKSSSPGCLPRLHTLARSETRQSSGQKKQGQPQFCKEIVAFLNPAGTPPIIPPATNKKTRINPARTRQILKTNPSLRSKKML
jgi:hypothetical protein